MNISPETKKISEIFSITGSNYYKIPIYQRNYSWGISQIETLIDDIHNEDKNYYIGNLLITSGEKDTSEIVDGQQRLTTIALILIAIYETASDFAENVSEKLSSNIIQEIGSIKNDIRRQLLVDGDLDTPRYIMLENDHEIFVDLLKITKDKVSKRWKNRVFGKRYNDTLSKIKNDFNQFADLKKFYKKLIDVEILKISVSNLSDAFSVFSALNSKGLPLTLVDLLKNEYLRRAFQDDLDTEEALSKWDTLISIFIDDQEIDINFTTKFLLNNYDALESTSTSSLTKSKALNKYNEILNARSSDYIDELIKRGMWYLYLNDGSVDKFGDKKIKDIIHELSYLDVSQSFPLLLYLFINHDELELDEKIIFDTLTLIKKFYIIRNVTQRPKASNIRSMFINLNRTIDQEELKGNAIYSLIREKLIKESDNINEFSNKLDSDGIYDKNPSTTRFLLMMLERENPGYFNKGQPDSLEDTVDKKGKKYRWTIEHILPQGKNLPDHWINMIGTMENYKNLQETHMHRLGNLTLSPYNAELGQKPFHEKRDKQDNGKYVGLRSGLYLNKSIFHSVSTFEDKTSWTIEDIDKRTMIMINEIIKFIEF